MLIFGKATGFINSSQVPVIVGDCSPPRTTPPPPTPCLAEEVSVEVSDEVGESRVVCFMGFVHIKMTSNKRGVEAVGWIWLGSDVLLGKGLHFRCWSISFRWQPCEAYTVFVPADSSLAPCSEG